MSKAALVAVFLALGSLVTSGGGLASKNETRATAVQADQPNDRASADGKLQIGQTVTIGGRSYVVIDALVAIGRIRNPLVKTMSSLVRLCRAARAFGFAATGPIDVGVVAWIPTNIVDCWASGDVSGGGPGGQTRSTSPCLQGFRTPDLRHYVVFAGSSARVCPAISTQAPGGWAATTQNAVSGLPANSEIRVKCQTWHQGEIWDYVAKYAAKLPVSKSTWWIQDAQLPTGYNWLPGVPRCNGLQFVW